MKDMFKNNIIILLGLVVILGTLIFVGGYLGYKKYQNFQDEREYIVKQTEAQQKALEQARVEIEKLSEQNQETKKQIKLQINSQHNNLSISSDEIAQYIGGVMQISCGDSSGSISLWKFSDNNLPMYAGVTNAHVLKGVTGHCFLSSGASSEKGIMSSVDPKDIYRWNSFADVAVLQISDPFRPKDNCTGLNCMQILSKDNLNYRISTLPKCPEKIAVGSPVITVGFPAFGTQYNSYSGILVSASHQIVSNGIISGYNDNSVNSLPYDNYYVSAKIDSGNSGGIAFSKTRSGLCVLGIPTWLQIGNYETGGVVQNIYNVMYKK